MDKGAVDEAIAACTQAIRLKPNSGMAYNRLGNVLGAAGRREDVGCEVMSLTPRLDAAA